MTFAWMILRASWKPVRVRYKGRAVSLDRGQLAISVRDLAEAMDRDKAWIERLFKRLKAETMIETVTEAGVSVVTICNYAQYQAEAEARETSGETLDEARARQTQDTEQEDKELKNSEPIGSSSVEIARKPFAYPEGMGIDRQHWADFLANRKRKRLGSTPTAYEGQLRALTALADDEWPPGRLVQHAAEKGWGSICDPRNGNPNVQSASTIHRFPARRDRASEIDDAARNLGFG
ncbi:MAG: hypothetical protein WC889_02885 [Myxococcota bacterium]|jgi:DNA-binding transcriptional regulator YhcF (GntR family)